MQGFSWRAGGLAVLSGVLQVLPFPIAGPVPLWRTAFCWIALVPLLYALLDTATPPAPLRRRVLHGAVLGYLAGITWYLGNCYWIFQTMYLYGGLAKPVAAGILVLFCLYLGLYHALFGAFVMLAERSRLGRQGALWLAPFLWVAVELSRARITGFPWDLLGIAQVDNPVLTRLAPSTGAYGLSFVIALVNSLWLVRLRLQDRRYLRPALTAAGVLLVVLYGAGVWFTARAPRSVPTALATLVQEDLDVGAVAEAGPQESTAQQLAAFSALSLAPSPNFLAGMPELASTPRIRVLRRIAQPPDVILWPESPARLEEHDPDVQAKLAGLARAAGAPLIVGGYSMTPVVRSASHPEGYILNNSASFIQPDGTFAGHYAKMHLVPFGEYVPFKQLFFFAGSLLADAGNFSPGQQRTLFHTGSHTFGTFICYESVFGDEIREFAQNGADVLVNLSNDGWYGDTSAPWQHLNMVRMRAIENHRWVLRATNTGVTASIDPAGRVAAAAPRHVRTAIQVPFGYERRTTFYTRHGDAFAWACVLASVAALLWAWRPRPGLGAHKSGALKSNHVD